jgi:hypothetical protein
MVVYNCSRSQNQKQKSEVIIIMKTQPLGKLFVFIAASLPLIAQTVSAQVLFSDNFNGMTGPSGYPATPTTGANFELGNAGRIGGSLTMPAGAAYINGTFSDSNEQLGDPTDLVGNPSDNSVAGDNLLLANEAADFINYDFSTINSALTITWNGNVKGGGGDWLSFMINTTASPSVWVLTSTVDSTLFQQNGGTQNFIGGSGGAGPSGTAPGNNVWQSYEVVLSDTAGTGSAFDGNGSKYEYYANGTLLGTQTLAQLTAGQGSLGFSASNIAGIDDIVVSVPEPSTYALLSGGLLSLMAFRRRISA